MTMTTCRACGADVHITHTDEDCPAGEADLRTPDELRGGYCQDPAHGSECDCGAEPDHAYESEVESRL